MRPADWAVLSALAYRAYPGILAVYGAYYLNVASSDANDYPAYTWAQLLYILLFLSTILSWRARFGARFLVGGYLAYRIAAFLGVYAWMVVKGVAWLGFYVTHFQAGVAFIVLVGRFFYNFEENMEWLGRSTE